MEKDKANKLVGSLNEIIVELEDVIAGLSLVGSLRWERLVEARLDLAKARDLIWQSHQDEFAAFKKPNK